MQVQCFLLQSTSYANEWPALCLFPNKRGAFLCSTRHTLRSLIISETEAKLNCCAARHKRGRLKHRCSRSMLPSPRVATTTKSSLQDLNHQYKWCKVEFFGGGGGGVGKHSSLFLWPKTPPPLTVSPSFNSFNPYPHPLSSSPLKSPGWG